MLRVLWEYIQLRKRSNAFQWLLFASSNIHKNIKSFNRLHQTIWQFQKEENLSFFNSTLYLSYFIFIIFNGNIYKIMKTIIVNN